MNSNILLGIMIPFIGTTSWFGNGIFYEKGNECPPAENASRICVGSNDRGVGLVASYSAIDCQSRREEFHGCLRQSAFYLEWFSFLFGLH